MVTKKNLVKMIFGIVMMVQAVSLFFIASGYVRGVVGRVSETLGLVAVLGGLAVTALMASTCVRLYEKYETLDVTKIRKLKG